MQIVIDFLIKAAEHAVVNVFQFKFSIYDINLTSEVSSEIQVVVHFVRNIASTIWILINVKRQLKEVHENDSIVLTVYFGQQVVID